MTLYTVLIGIMTKSFSSSQIEVIPCQMVLLSSGKLSMPLLLLSSSVWPTWFLAGRGGEFSRLSMPRWSHTAAVGCLMSSFSFSGVWLSFSLCWPTWILSGWGNEFSRLSMSDQAHTATIGCLLDSFSLSGF